MLAYILTVLLTVGCLLYFPTVSAQPLNSVRLSFLPIYDGKSIMLKDSAFKRNNSDNFQIDALKFYVSNVLLLYKDELVFEEQNSSHLVDASEIKSLIISIPMNQKQEFDRVRFNLGLDSVTNVSGAFGGDLDPTKGMYWTWQNGYINFKLEGKSNVCISRNNEFQFHLGGYQYPFNSLQTLEFPAIETHNIEVTMDIKHFIDSIDLKRQNTIMSPGAEAILLSNKISKSFRIK